MSEEFYRDDFHELFKKYFAESDGDIALDILLKDFDKHQKSLNEIEW